MRRRPNRKKIHLRKCSCSWVFVAVCNYDEIRLTACLEWPKPFQESNTVLHNISEYLCERKGTFAILKLIVPIIYSSAWIVNCRDCRNSNALYIFVFISAVIYRSSSLRLIAWWIIPILFTARFQYRQKMFAQLQFCTRCEMLPYIFDIRGSCSMMWQQITTKLESAHNLFSRVYLNPRSRRGLNKRQKFISAPSHLSQQS